MVAVLAIAAASGGAGVLAAVAEAATGGDQGALYASVSAVMVAMIGGTVAIVTSRRNPPPPDPQSVRYVDAPTSNALPAAMAELYEHVKDELETVKIERDLWRRRAQQAGWDDQ